MQTRQFQAALDVGASAYAFFLAIRDPHYAAGTGANLAEASYELGDFDGAARYAAEVLNLGDRFAAPYVRFTLGQLDLAQNNPPAAIANFSTLMQIAQQNDDPFMVAYAQRALGQAQLAADNVSTAPLQIDSALALFRQLDIPGEITATEELLAEMLSRWNGGPGNLMKDELID